MLDRKDKLSQLSEQMRTGGARRRNTWTVGTRRTNPTQETHHELGKNLRGTNCHTGGTHEGLGKNQRGTNPTLETHEELGKDLREINCHTGGTCEGPGKNQRENNCHTGETHEGLGKNQREKNCHTRGTHEGPEKNQGVGQTITLEGHMKDWERTRGTNCHTEGTHEGRTVKGPEGGKRPHWRDTQRSRKEPEEQTASVKGHMKDGLGKDWGRGDGGKWSHWRDTQRSRKELEGEKLPHQRDQKNKLPGGTRGINCRTGGISDDWTDQKNGLSDWRDM